MRVAGLARTVPVAFCAFVLAGCETTNESEWASAPGGTPFDQAEQTCEAQLEFVAQEAARRGFFVECMAAFDWTPKPGAGLPG